MGSKTLVAAAMKPWVRQGNTRTQRGWDRTSSCKIFQWFEKMNEIPSTSPFPCHHCAALNPRLSYVVADSHAFKKYESRARFIADSWWRRWDHLNQCSRMRRSDSYPGFAGHGVFGRNQGVPWIHLPRSCRGFTDYAADSLELIGLQLQDRGASAPRTGVECSKIKKCWIKIDGLRLQELGSRASTVAVFGSCMASS